MTAQNTDCGRMSLGVILLPLFESSICFTLDALDYLASGSWSPDQWEVRIYISLTVSLVWEARRLPGNAYWYGGWRVGDMEPMDGLMFKDLSNQIHQRLG